MPRSWANRQKAPSADLQRGTDEFLDEAFVEALPVKLPQLLAADVDEHWANSLNMMTRNLRAATMKAMADDNTRGKIDDEQIQSVFHLREIDAVPANRSPIWCTGSRTFTICQKD